MATPRGVQGDKAYHDAYWKAFYRFFGSQNGAVVKSMLLAKFPRGDRGKEEIDRVCFGLRQTMGWIADAVERAALADLGSPADMDAGRLAPAQPDES